ncbi:Protein fem-1-like protein [Dinothrombium tinctorium]|uniref:Protein fem-1-like protein n=1 Tax=Dinothrombium tinctorium TaxID=1965070 RepID=A0A3S3PB96_9ACAR|nr:Protein fem-1-like protein [Dinothrombium tinctorium]RWS09027.1 Protein fem-1-like protein [Dinothrombium tinctorium]RWS10986.1 Protein fem-1-like protein [Dinothrombium tinctorium]
MASTVNSNVVEKEVITSYQCHIHRKIYEAARDGTIITLYSLLSNVPSSLNVKQLLDTPLEEKNIKCTPLVIAAFHGHEHVVNLLMKYGVDIESEGVVHFDGYLISGATALWCAAGFGHLNVVKALVKKGADVNHPTHTNSTPLRAACFDGRLDIVQYLVDNGADINIPNKFNNSCLMIAAYKGHLNVVEYLLKLGSDPNVQAKCGGTALHFAAENGHLDVIKSLLQHGALLTLNAIGMTPLTSAAEQTKAHVVEYFISTEYISQLEKIEALELLGASYANDKDNYSIERVYYYLHWAMRERYKDPQNPLLKRILPAVPAYENRIECQTLEELQAIQYKQNALHMEGLIIRERILSPRNPDVAHPIIYRGAVYADNARFDRCLYLWLHALKLRNMICISIRKDLLRFAQVFSQMFHVGVEVPFNVLFEVLEIAVQELRKNNQSLFNTTEEGLKEGLQEEVDDNIHTILYLLVIATKTLKTRTKSEEESLYRIVYQLQRIPVRTSNGSTLLHLCVNAETPVDDFHTKNVCKFPCSSTTKLLVKCGADVNAKDNNGNTALHVIVGYQKPISDFLTLHDIIDCLYKGGAHMDYTNKTGQTPLESATTGVAEIILKSKADIEMNLKCLAAKAINYHGIDYIRSVPVSLVSFIEDHWVRKKE